jgi:hypothetical protein
MFKLFHFTKLCDKTRNEILQTKTKINLNLNVWHQTLVILIYIYSLNNKQRQKSFLFKNNVVHMYIHVFIEKKC